MTTSNRTSDDEGRVVHGGELPEDSRPTLDDVVVDKPGENSRPASKRKVRVYGRPPEMAQPFDWGCIGVCFQVRLEEDAKTYFPIILSAYPFKVPVLKNGKVEHINAERTQEDSSFFIAGGHYLKDLGYEEGKEYAGGALGPDYPIQFTHDLAAVNNCSLNPQDLLEEFFEMVDQDGEARIREKELDDKLSRYKRMAVVHEEELDKSQSEVDALKKRLKHIKEENEKEYFMVLEGVLAQAQSEADEKYAKMEGKYKSAYTSGIFSRIRHAWRMLWGSEPKEK
jgi:hypothetical protein